MALTFLALSVAYAQDEDGDTPPVVAATDIVWPEISTDLAPLEELQLPELQVSDGSRGERQVYLAVGQAAPWPGVLLNPAAIAFIIAERQAAWERAQATLIAQRASDWNRLQLEVGQLRLQIQTDRRRADIVVDGLQRETQRLRQIHSDFVEGSDDFWNTDFGQILQWGLVIIGAAAVGFVIGYVASEFSD